MDHVWLNQMIRKYQVPDELKTKKPGVKNTPGFFAIDNCLLNFEHHTYLEIGDVVAEF
jgi:hypothetical protein